jgi:hypothetical protein
LPQNTGHFFNQSLTESFSHAVLSANDSIFAEANYIRFNCSRSLPAAFLKRKTIKLRFNSINLSGLHWAIAEQ